MMNSFIINFYSKALRTSDNKTKKHLLSTCASDLSSIQIRVSKKIITKTKNFYFYRITNQIFINSVQGLKFVIDRDDVAQYYLFSTKQASVFQVF